MVVGFVNSGFMTLTQAVGVIMGANIGPTMTAQLLAFNISAYALVPIAVGFFMTFTSITESIKHFVMEEALASARTEIPLIDKMRRTYRLSLRIAKMASPPAVVQDI